MVTAGTQIEVLIRFLAELRQITVDWRPLLNLTKRFASSAQAFGQFDPELSSRLRGEIGDILPAAVAGESPNQMESRYALQRTTVFVAETLAFGLTEAIWQSFDDLELEKVDNPPALLRTLRVFLDEGELRRELSASDLTRLAAKLKSAPPKVGVLPACLRLLGLTKTLALNARNDTVHYAALPLMKEAAENDQIDVALTIENALYEEHIKTIETQAHYLENFRAIEANLASLTPAPLPIIDLPHTLPRVAFVLPNGGQLAHTDLLLSLLRGLTISKNKAIEPVVYMYMDIDGGWLGSILNRLNIEWRSTNVESTYEDKFDLARRNLSEMKIDAIVFVSLATRLAYFCKQPLAAIQIWWPMKFTLPLFEGLHGRISYNSIVKHAQIIDGRLWRSGPIAVPKPDPPTQATVDAVRGRFSGKTILGVIAREEKIADKDFLEAVVEILKRHPDTVLLWTGRARLPVIDQAFERGGVSDRCHFEGWIDPTSYIAAFDVMLETFPLTGLVVGWAMALGKPVISVGDRGWLGAYLKPIFDGTVTVSPEDQTRIDEIFSPIKSRLPGIWAEAPGDMVAFADALLTSEDLRRLVGQVQKRYVETFMLDEIASAEILAEHIVDIISEAQTAASAHTMIRH
jgi:glycosyltransferase involved in cell wall biosynthesis